MFGLDGLGGYAVQYARLLAGGAKTVVFERNPTKLEMAKKYGADHTISIVARSAADIARDLESATGQGDLDAIIECVGTPEMIQFGFGLLGTSGHYVDVGLLGDRIDSLLFPRINREQAFHGSERRQGAGSGGQDPAQHSYDWL
jgi:propanol-preferring alcohol dehydrogenase